MRIQKHRRGLTFLMLLLPVVISANTAFAINVSGKGRAWKYAGSSTSNFQAKYNATTRAISALNADARRKCPGGYAITSGPFCKVKATWVWNFPWPYWKASAKCQGTIECNRSRRYPSFHDYRRIPINPKLAYRKAIVALQNEHEALVQHTSAFDIAELVSTYNSEEELYNMYAELDEHANQYFEAPSYQAFAKQIKESFLYRELEKVEVDIAPLGSDLEVEL